MTQYIDKSTLVAEIERRLKGLNDCHADRIAGYAGEISGLKRLLSFIDTLEVKEMNKNNEIADKLNDIINFHKEKVYKGQWYKWMREKVSYHNGVISGIKQCLSIIRNR